MTVSSEVSRLTYNGNGATTAFSVTFKFIDDADLIVYVDDELQVITTDYTVSGGDGSTGTVTFLSAPPSGTGNVVIIRDPAILQETDYQAADSFPAESHERALDRLTMIAQRNRDLIDRAFVLPDSDTSGASTTLPIPEASKVIGWNSSGTALTNLDAATLATTVLGDNKIVDTFTGDGSDTTFTLSADPIVENNTDVFIDGVHQSKETYSISGTTLTFGTAPSNGSGIVVQQSAAVNYPVTEVADDTISTAKILDDAVTNAKLANMAAGKIKARKTASTGDPEDCTLSEVLDLVGSAAQGDLLYRGASSWTRLGAGTSGYFLKTLGAAQNPEWAQVSSITLGASQSSTSGTSIDFTSIPAGVKRITVTFDGVSTNGADQFLFQLGDSGGVETSGYKSATFWYAGGSGGASASTAGFIVGHTGGGASNTFHGAVVFTRYNTSHAWVGQGTIAFVDANTGAASVGGSKTLSAELDRIRITTTGGTNTFDAGTINILYEV